MGDRNIESIEAIIDYIETHLDGRLELEQMAQAAHYSKYHLHRMFTETVGMTLHDYVQRRQLTEAAKLLVFSQKPILDIALMCGYESQQAFTAVFRAMYKIPPAEFRQNRVFYPLQLRFSLHPKARGKAFSAQEIRLAQKTDLPAWMELMRMVIDGYPVMDENDYQDAICACMENQTALVLYDGQRLVGAMAYSAVNGCIDFLGIHPQYRRQGLQQLFLDALLEQYLPGREISMTTYREGDRADVGHREALRQLGFAERELLVEFGYPTQRFVHAPKEEKER